MGFGMGFHAIGSIMPLFVIIIFVIVIGTFVAAAVKGVSQWHGNNQSPLLTVDATVVTKRGDVKRHTDNHMMNETGMAHTHTSTTYYATFQVASGDRMEFQVPSSEYGLLVEGDKGKLTFQGTRYHEFERQY